MAGILDYSTTADDNDSDPPNGAPEGMRPGKVNDVIRQIMADIAALPADAGSSLIGFLQSGTGAVATDLQTRGRFETYAQDFGATGDGVTDDTAALLALLERGGDIIIPDGTYLIKGTGADSGGVNATITTSLKVKCQPHAIFTTDSLDNDLIRLSVPSDGSGLPADGITVMWEGGIFDQTNQKNSTVIPFIDKYPASNAGSSATCDALSIRGDYSVSGVEYHGIVQAIVQNVRFIAGTHWESAGGDSGLFLGGCRKQIVRGISSIGSRDLGVYCSGSTNGTLDCDTVVEKCTSINSFGAVNVKRSSGDTRIVDNRAINCPRGWVADWVIGAGANRVKIAGNTGSNIGIPVRMQLVSGFDISDNHVSTLGALLEDGSSVESYAGCNGIELYGCSKGNVKHNTFLEVQSGVATAYSSDYMIIKTADFTHDATTTPTTNCAFLENIGDGLRTAGSDGGSSNAFIENYVINAVTASYVITLGTNSFELRVDPTSMARGYTNPVGFSDGTVAAPAIVRKAQTSVGLRFATSLIGLSIASNDAIQVDNSTTAGNTRLLVYDVDKNATVRVSVGANDSGGTGYKLLRIPN